MWGTCTLFLVSFFSMKKNPNIYMFQLISHHFVSGILLWTLFISKKFDVIKLMWTITLSRGGSRIFEISDNWIYTIHTWNLFLDDFVLMFTSFVKKNVILPKIKDFWVITDRTTKTIPKHKTTINLTKCLSVLTTYEGINALHQT